MTHPMTMAYLSKNEVALAQRISAWVSDEAIFASFPEFLLANGKKYITTQFGYCPADSGQTGYFAVAENQMLQYWEIAAEDWNMDLTEPENLALATPKEFLSLGYLEYYIRTGEML